MDRTEADNDGIAQTGIDGVRRCVEDLIEHNEIPGAVSAVMKADRLVWFEAQGHRDPIAGTKMHLDDIFRIMSSTKPVTAAAVLMMQDEGKLNIDDPVSRFIPSFAQPRVAIAPKGSTDPTSVTLIPAQRELTIKDLLTHTGGLTDDPSAGPAYLLNEPLTRRGALATYVPPLGLAALAHQPGTRWHYSPFFGWDTLLRIVEIVSDTNAQDFLRERVFEPLEMRDTGFVIPEDQQHRLVEVFQFENGAWTKASDFLPRPPAVPYISGGGGLYSTVIDYLQFQLMLLNGGALKGHRLLSQQAVAQMSTNHVGNMFSEWLPPITAGYGMGLGVRVVEDPSKAPSGRPVGAYGWPGAYGTEGVAIPSCDVAAVIFVQVLPINFRVGTAFGGAVGRACGT